MEAASDYLKSIPVRGDGRDVVVMGVDDSALSNLGFFREHKYGWSAHPKVLEVYAELKDAKIGVVILSGRPESQRAITTENLIEAGFNAGWEDLILRTPEEEALTNREYKSQRRVELEGKGYRILFNVGDQWSDLLGPAKSRTFKIPNPMYYVY
ncbi:hypothetical protein R1sor_024218 [Riccia sorocarpa]|uniref:Acid phosphatase n=1 Tax=Riccia sorocarpa TaxID=122646 RepID=A0ABD3GSV5_9MARC